MIGAIIGDIIGSRFESSPKYPKLNVPDKNFDLYTSKCRYTDDSVLTCATAEAILNINDNFDIPKFEMYYRKWGNKYKNRGYGSMFQKWLQTPNITTANSYSNGVMMRCSPIGMFYRTFPIDSVLEIAQRSSKYTHNSPESIRGVQSIVSAIYMAYNKKTKLQIKNHVEEYYGHMLHNSLEDLRNSPKTSIRCNVTAPQALTCFMESTDYESAIRNAIYIGGDTDTNAAIAGAIAEAYYGHKSISDDLINMMFKILTKEMINVIVRFYYKCQLM